MLVSYAALLHQLRQNVWRRSGDPALADAAFFANLFSDDAWMPWALEFFYQVQEGGQRAAFLRAAEALQMYLELQGDAGGRAAGVQGGGIRGTRAAKPRRLKLFL